MNYAIETRGLVRKFGEFTAVDGLNLSIAKGELFGFLGPNGAGKTTTIRMLTTLTPPTQGSAKVGGFDVQAQSDKVRSIIGVVPQGFALFEELTPTENLWFIGKLFGMTPEETAERGDELLKIVGLHEKREVVCSSFSGGMKQRLSVAAGLLHEPKILFMDEPTTGLDPQSRIALRELTRKLNKDEGITVVYTTHDMEEADKLCDRIAVMDAGQIIAEGTPEELKSRHGGGNLIKLKLGEGEATPALVAELKKISGATSSEARRGEVELHVRSIGGGLVHKLSSHLSKKRVQVHELTVSEPTLEQVFINLTKKEFRE